MNGKTSFPVCVQQFFKDYLEHQKGCTANTLDSYSVTFSQFVEYLGPKRVNNMAIEQLEKDEVTAFMKHLKSKGLSDGSCNIRLAHIKSFARYITANVPSVLENCRQILCIAQRKTEKKPPVSISLEAVKAMTHAPDTRTKEGLRHAAIISLLYDSACRVEELIGLTVADVSIGSHPKIHVLGKGRKHRLIPISPQTAKLLDRYIQKYKLFTPESLLFESRSGGKMTRQGVNYILKKYSSIIRQNDDGLISPDISVHPHIMRHARATHLVDSGKVSLKDVRDFLGHESVMTTEIYLSSNPEHTRKAIEDASSALCIPKAGTYNKKEKESLEEFLKTRRL